MDKINIDKDNIDKANMDRAEYIRALNKIWRSDNKEWLEFYHAQYRKLNRNKMRELNRASYHRNKYKRQQKQLTPEQIAARLESERIYREEQILKNVI